MPCSYRYFCTVQIFLIEIGNKQQLKAGSGLPPLFWMLWRPTRDKFIIIKKKKKCQRIYKSEPILKHQYTNSSLRLLQGNTCILVIVHVRMSSIPSLSNVAVFGNIHREPLNVTWIVDMSYSAECSTETFTIIRYPCSSIEQSYWTVVIGIVFHLECSKIQVWDMNDHHVYRQVCVKIRVAVLDRRWVIIFFNMFLTWWSPHTQHRNKHTYIHTHT